MAYLSNKHGLVNLYPTDPAERAMVDNAMFYLIGTLPARGARDLPDAGFAQYAGEVGTAQAPTTP